MGVHRLRLSAGLTIESAIRAIKNDPSVASVQPNYIYRALGTSNDPQMAGGNLWGLHNTGQNGGTVDVDIDAPEAWDLTTGSPDVVVAVIDSGVDYSHPDLAANMWTNPGEVPGNGLDDDANGYVDDVHGWNAVANNGNPMDDNSHGTHVAGTIGAVGNNALGVVGVSWKVKIVAAKFLAADGSGTTAGALACLNYVNKLKDSGVNVIATNNSWGGGPYDAALRDAIERSNTRGILFVAASGNGDSYGRAINNDSSPQYPASYTNANVLAVTATDRNDRKAAWANYGATSVDLGAPGVDIWSTVPGNGYDVYSGTSMATPQVTGAVALLKSYVGSALTHLQIKDRLLSTGDYVADLAGKTATGRRLNVFNALTNTIPPAPVNKTMQVMVTTNKSAYRFGESVSITITATDKTTGAPLSGAAVSVTVQTPYGYTSTGSGTTNTSGVIAFTYSPRSSYGSGTYRVTATTSKSGYSSGSGSSTFTASR